MLQIAQRFSRTLVLTCAALLCLPQAADADTWHACVSRAVITPKEPMWMSGYAARDHAAEGTLHDLWCKVLALKTAENQAVLVSLDLVGISRELSESILAELRKRYGLKRHQVCLATSHTHTGPVVDGNLNAMYFLDEASNQQVRDYGRFLQETVVRSVGDAIENLAPASLEFAVGEATFAVNRRENREADVPELREKGALKGPFDHDVPVITVRHGDRLAAIVFGYACHATTLGFYQWSGDWPGFGQIELEKMFPGTTALFFAGCGADQNPLPRRTVELAQKYGREIAVAVQREIVQKRTKPLAASLRTAASRVRLPFAKPLGRDQLTDQLEDPNKYVAGRARVLLQRLEETGSVLRHYDYPVQAWRLGDRVDFVMLGGEVVVDFALRIKAMQTTRTVFVGAYMNDVMAYIPSERVLREGRYEGATAMVYYGLPSAWASGVEDAICNAVEELMKSFDRASPRP